MALLITRWRKHLPSLASSVDEKGEAPSSWLQLSCSSGACSLLSCDCCYHLSFYLAPVLRTGAVFYVQVMSLPRNRLLCYYANNTDHLYSSEYHRRYHCAPILEGVYGNHLSACRPSPGIVQSDHRIQIYQKRSGQNIYQRSAQRPLHSRAHPLQ